MKKTIQLIAIMFLFINFATQADVEFSLTNKSSQPILVTGHINDKELKVNFQTMRFLDHIKTLKPDENLTLDIENGKLNLMIRVFGGNEKSCRYETLPSANNKDKILIWDGLKLYPPSEKHHLVGPLRTKTTIKNNISMGELFETERMGF
jgi:hypothetical protein